MLARPYVFHEPEKYIPQKAKFVPEEDDEIVIKAKGVFHQLTTEEGLTLVEKMIVQVDERITTLIDYEKTQNEEIEKHLLKEIDAQTLNNNLSEIHKNMNTIIGILYENLNMLIGATHVLRNKIGEEGKRIRTESGEFVLEPNSEDVLLIDERIKEQNRLITKYTTFINDARDRSKMYNDIIDKNQMIIKYERRGNEIIKEGEEEEKEELKGITYVEKAEYVRADALEEILNYKKGQMNKMYEIVEQLHKDSTNPEVSIYTKYILDKAFIEASKVVEAEKLKYDAILEILTKKPYIGRIRNYPKPTYKVPYGYDKKIKQPGDTNEEKEEYRKKMRTLRMPSDMVAQYEQYLSDSKRYEMLQEQVKEERNKRYRELYTLKVPVIISSEQLSLNL